MATNSLIGIWKHLQEQKSYEMHEHDAAAEIQVEYRKFVTWFYDNWRKDEHI